MAGRAEPCECCLAKDLKVHRDLARKGAGGAARPCISTPSVCSLRSNPHAGRLRDVGRGHTPRYGTSSTGGRAGKTASYGRQVRKRRETRGHTEPPTMFAGPQSPHAMRPNAAVTLQATHAGPSVALVPLRTPAGTVQPADGRFRTPGVPQETTIVNRQTGLVGQQTAPGNGLFTGSSFR